MAIGVWVYDGERFRWLGFPVYLLEVILNDQSIRSLAI